MVVMGTGNPRVIFYSPAPVPAENPSRVYGYGFPVDNPTGLFKIIKIIKIIKFNL